MTESATTSAVEPERGPSLLINGLLGGVVAVLVGFLPFSTVFGGAVAGYLQGPDRRAAMKAGALAGLVALVPLLLLAVLGAGFLFVVPVGSGSPGGAGPGAGFWGFLAVAALTVVGVLGIYTVGGGALGGYVGSYLKEDRLRNAAANAEPDEEYEAQE